MPCQDHTNEEYSAAEGMLGIPAVHNRLDQLGHGLWHKVCCPASNAPEAWAWLSWEKKFCTSKWMVLVLVLA